MVAIDITSIDPKRLVVQAWTSQCDNRYADGTWHTVDLTYVGEEHDGSGMVQHVYGQSDIITSDRDFEFTYCLRVNYTHVVHLLPPPRRLLLHRNQLVCLFASSIVQKLVVRFLQKIGLHSSHSTDLTRCHR